MSGLVEAVADAPDFGITRVLTGSARAVSLGDPLRSEARRR
jgi:hypothetical protein